MAFKFSLFEYYKKWRRRYNKNKKYSLPWSGITISFSWTCLKQERIVDCCDTSWSCDIRSPDKRTPLLAVSEVLLVLVDEPGVVFTAHQDDRGVGAEPPDLLVPHGPDVRDSNGISELTLISLPAVLQRDHSPRVIAHQHHVSPAIGEPPVLKYKL